MCCNFFSQIKCYHKNTLSSGRDIIFRCQFHTGAIKDHGLVLDKTELDDACKGLSTGSTLSRERVNKGTKRMNS